MITDNLKKNIEQSVEILRRYRETAIQRDKPDAKRDIETVMHTVQDLCKLVFDDNPQSLYKKEIENIISDLQEAIVLKDWDLVKLTLDCAIKTIEGNYDKKCTWKPSNEEGETYSTSCGRLFTFIEAGIKENDFTHCCYCGCEIKES